MTDNSETDNVVIDDPMTENAETQNIQPQDSPPQPAETEAETETEDSPSDGASTPVAPTDEAAAPEPARTSPFAAPPVAEAPASFPEPSELAPGAPVGGSPFGLVFQAPDLSDVPARSRRRRATSSMTDGQDTAATVQPAEDSDEPRPDATPSPATDIADEAEPQSMVEDDSTGERLDGDDEGGARGRRRRRGGKGRRGRTGAESTKDSDDDGRDSARSEDGPAQEGRPQDADEQHQQDDSAGEGDDESDTGTKRRRRRRRGEGTERGARDEVSGVQGSTRLEAKRQRRREGREAGRRRTIISEAEFLARRESVERVMVVRGLEDRTQIGVLEDGVLVEHYVSRQTETTMAGNVYLGRVQNVLPSMEAAFVDVGKGRNAVLYAGEVNWDAAGLKVDQAKRIENALSSGESVLAQVSKDPIGHKGARLTSQVSLPGRYLVYVPDSSMTGISRKLPDTERSRLKKILKDVVPDDAGVIVRTAAEGASEAELRADVERLTALWERIEAKAKTASAPALLHGEPDMTVRVIRDVFNEDFTKLIVSGDAAWKEVSSYIDSVAPDLADRVQRWDGEQDVFTHHRVAESLAKAMDRKVWLPSGGSLVIDRTEAMTVVDVNTGKFVGSGGNLEQTVTKNNIEAAEEIVRQLRLRDIGGIIVIDFIDMVLESNRELVVRRLLECLGRDRTKHQVAEVTSLGLVQMTRKRVGAGLIEVFSESCEHCSGRGILVHPEPIDKPVSDGGGRGERGRGRKGRSVSSPAASGADRKVLPAPNPQGPTPAQIAAAAHAAALQSGSTGEAADATAQAVVAEVRAVGVDTAEPIEDSQPVAEDATPAQPVVTTRPRRKRGRVVAAAGPPGSAPGEASSTG